MKPRYAIAFGILVVACGASYILRRIGVEKELLGAVFFGTVPISIVVALGGKCGRRCRAKCNDEDSAAVASWFPFMGS